MNHNLYLIFLTFLSIGCNSVENESTESLGENRQVESVETCLCDDLKTDVKGLLMKDGHLYTGECVINYKQTDQTYIEKQILNGELNGKIIYYAIDGKVLFEEKYEKGKHQLNLDVENITCNCADLKKESRNNQIVYLYEGQLFRGQCYYNFPGIDQPYIKITYADGLRSGFTWYYNKVGDVLYTEKYEANELVKVIHPKK